MHPKCEQMIQDGERITKARKLISYTSQIYVIVYIKTKKQKAKKKKQKQKLTPASDAIGFPRRLNSPSSSLIVLLIRD